eukprot:gene23946-30230_t
MPLLHNLQGSGSKNSTKNNARVMFASTGVRMLSTAAPKAAPKAVSHVPPKKIHGIIGRYAGSTYTAASKINALERVEKELAAFSNLVKTNEGFANFLNNPTIRRQDKVTKVGDLFDEKTFSHITRNLLITLCANGRVNEADKVVGAFNEIMQASRGTVRVTIIAAEELKKKQLEAIQAGVMNFIEAGQTVEIVSEVNADILGGLQVMIGDRFLDLSVQNRVTDLSKALDARV